jgi:M6 family metalloprotease-like protein
MNIHGSLLRRTAVIPALVAGLMLTGVTTIAADAAPVRSEFTAASSTAAPELAGTAGTFLLYMFPNGQGAGPESCTGIGLNFSADPSISRRHCGFLNFIVSGASGDISVDLYAEDAETPFATLPADEDATAPGEYQASITPEDTWVAGKVRGVITDSEGPIGEYTFFYNNLVATLDASGTTAPGDPFEVSGSIVEHVGGTVPSNTGVAASFDLEVIAPDGGVLDSLPVVAASDGSFTQEVPGSATAGLTATAATNFTTTVALRAVDASYTDSNPVPPPATGVWGAKVAGTTGHTLAVPATSPTIVNSFVSSVGWVKPGDTYPSRVIVTNPTDAAVTATVELTAPTGASFTGATGPGTHPVSPAGFTWSPGAIPAGESATLVLEAQAATTGQLDTIVWRDLSSTAVLKVSGDDDQTSLSHGPKVIPPSETYNSARYGDRPFPIVPVQYTDRDYQDTHSGDSLEGVINDPNLEGSTFNLFQEMSLGQLFPQGAAPAAGIATADFDSYEPGFEFTQRAVPGNSCSGETFGDSPVDVTDTPLYPERITNGVYNLPGTTGYYGSDSNGSALLGAVGGVGALQNIDSGCGDTGKLVYDTAAIADPEIDYSDYDTDKDGVVDFFMVVFAGCGGNGESQLSVAGCAYPDAPYDNVWPHSSSLENGYSDPVTGLPGFTSDDQLKDLEGNPLWYTDTSYTEYTTTDNGDALKVYVRVGPYNVNPETAIDFASVISHEYGHSLGLPDFYSTGTRETYGDWNLMASDQSQNIDAFGRQELGWVVPQVIDETQAQTGITDSKQDTGVIEWQTPDGTPYTLTHGVDGIVHNSDMFVAKLPGRILLDPTAFDAGGDSEGATPSHLWWSGSGNDFGCSPSSGRNFDLSIPQLADLTDNATVTLSFKSRWDIEWDYDYGYVLTTTDGGETYTSHASEQGFTTSNTDPTAGNPNAIGCQTTYDNGLTGTSGSYAAGTEASDRKLSETPEAVFLTDSYDISDLAGEANGALRFSYYTDGGLARPGWFIDDVTVTVDPDGAGAEEPYDIFASDFETSGGPSDPQVFNGGCREDLSTAQACTLGWKYLQAGAAAVQDHAYYMEMRDRSGFDLDGNGQANNGGAGFGAGFYLAYTDESHGYGNVGTDDPPAQSPLDSVPQPGNEAPNLDDAAFTAAAARSTFSDDPADPHVDNYSDPTTDSGNWEFAFDCLDFTVDSMSGEGNGPEEADGDLTGDVTFTVGAGCGEFDYGHVADGGGGGGDNTAPTAVATATPTTAEAGDEIRLSGAASTDLETPNDLDYSWDFDNGGSTKDAGTRLAKVTYTEAGTYTPTLTVTDPQGLVSTATATVVVRETLPEALLKVSPKKPFISTRIAFNGLGSTGLDLSYKWTITGRGKTVASNLASFRTKLRKPGYYKVSLTVTDDRDRTDTTTKRILVRRAVSCNGKAVNRTGSWRVVPTKKAPNDAYCDNLGKGRGQDTMTYRFSGPQVDVYHGRDRRGGKAVVFIDGKRVGTVTFKNGSEKLKFRHHQVFKGLGQGRHTLQLVVQRGTAYLASFITIK